jgi:uncharacterized protein (TIGR02453 family)
MIIFEIKSMSFFKQDFLDFFIELAPNNNKDWFDANRKRYEYSVREPFKLFVNHIISKIAETDDRFEELDAKDCIFRINRDIRFSKDKTPYKMQVSAVVAPEGKKSKAINGVYFELGPEHLRVYGGVYEIDKEDLMKLRIGIAENPDTFKKLYSESSFVNMYGELQGQKNKIIAKELKEAAEKEPLIYNKQWYFYTQFEPETILRDDIDEVILGCYNVGKPIQLYFNDLIK